MEEQQRLHHYRGEYAPGIYNAFPFDYWHRWKIQDVGPQDIPAAGTTITTDTLNFPYTRKIASSTSGSP